MAHDVPRRAVGHPPTANLDRVTEGMRVVDAGGEEIGRVDLVRRGDPNTVVVQVPPGGGPGTTLTDIVEAAVDEPDVPADAAARLRRVGYLKVDGHGVPHDAVYVEADQISEVTEEAVRLSVSRSDLTPEE